MQLCAQVLNKRFVSETIRLIRERERESGYPIGLSGALLFFLPSSSFSSFFIPRSRSSSCRAFDFSLRAPRWPQRLASSDLGIGRITVIIVFNRALLGRDRRSILCIAGRNAKNTHACEYYYPDARARRHYALYYMRGDHLHLILHLASPRDY